MKITNEIRREVMLTAWYLKRDEPTRPFSCCLKGAWKMSKGISKEMTKIQRRMDRGMRHLRLSSSLGRSAIQRSTAHDQYGRVIDHHAAYTTSTFGC